MSMSHGWIRSSSFVSFCPSEYSMTDFLDFLRFEMVVISSPDTS